MATGGHIQVQNKLPSFLRLSHFNSTDLLCCAFWRVIICMWSVARMQSVTQPPSHVTPYL